MMKVVVVAVVLVVGVLVVGVMTVRWTVLLMLIMSLVMRLSWRRCKSSSRRLLINNIRLM